MMKNFKKFTAFVLALCMLFSLSVAAFAAEADEHTIYDSAPDEETVVSNEVATSGKAVRMFRLQIEHISGKKVQER